MNEPPILATAGDSDEGPKLRAWSVARGIARRERNVNGDPDATPALHRSGTFATPLLVVGETTVVGFRPDAIAAALSE